MTHKGNTRVFATNLRKLADWLDSKPEFHVERTVAELPRTCFYSEKQGFLEAIRAIGSGVKGEGLFPEYLMFTSNTTPEGVKVSVEVNRDAVCKLIKPAQTIPAEYDCEPLLSQAEEAELETK